MSDQDNDITRDGDVSPNRLRPAVVYGNDDRMDVYAYNGDPYWVEAANSSVVALVHPDQIDASNPNDITLLAPTLQESQDLCPTERFGNQLTAAFCSGALIDDDLVLTSAECVANQSECQSTHLVFNYRMLGADVLKTITEDDVFSCQEIVVRDEGDIDYAILRLDRPATPRFKPADVTGVGSAVPEGTPLVVIGSPSGLPFKIDDGGHVRDDRLSTLDYFVATFDSFGGNSGSGVYDYVTLEIVGILVRGETDYVWNAQDQCYVVNVCDESACRGEDSTYAYRAIEDFCSVAQSGRLCGGPYCGDGTCDPDESTATCPDDCGTSCGDGACNGTETAEGCPEDCTVCGDSICSPDESLESCPEDCSVCGDGYCTGAETYVICSVDCFCGDGICDAAEDGSFCCNECGCPSAWECTGNACTLLSGDGDSCGGGPIVIQTTEGLTAYSGDTASATHTATGSCVSLSDTPDRIYAFALDFPTHLAAEVAGFDTVMYLRSTCDDPTSEIACNDDSDPPGNEGSRIDVTLDPGTYFLFVDGYSDHSGPYDLLVDFAQEDCVDHSECDDGLFCNGAESCDPANGCQPGTPACDDGTACSDDICIEGTSDCAHTCNATSSQDPCCDQPVCSGEAICQEAQYSQTANTIAGSHGRTSLVRSGALNSLALVLIPMGGVIFLRILRRKK